MQSLEKRVDRLEELFGPSGPVVSMIVLTALGAKTEPIGLRNEADYWAREDGEALEVFYDRLSTQLNRGPKTRVAMVAAVYEETK